MVRHQGLQEPLELEPRGGAEGGGGRERERERERERQSERGTEGFRGVGACEGGPVSPAQLRIAC